MVAARQRLQLLLDEGLPKRQSFLRLNARCDIVHVKHDLALSGSADERIYAFASAEHRIVVTLNLSDFKRLLSQNGSTVIGLSPVLTRQQIDTKLLALIRRLQPHHLKGHFFKIDQTTHVSNLLEK